ncbi:sulfur carrier protein ThiS [Aureimonas populi]|uniref:Sulfur carrier protein ThiS n=1 Tax=Aureimonas populi TaxID=1701758 RepID=A0ABW5CIV6_9HYPH|nr:sulfur carrier protein ThiS [Aureimonas populi]
MRTLIVNGEEHRVDSADLAALLSALGYEGPWLATAVNGRIVHKPDRAREMLRDGDRIEILSPMEGG